MILFTLDFSTAFSNSVEVSGSIASNDVFRKELCSGEEVFRIASSAGTPITERIEASPEIELTTTSSWLTKEGTAPAPAVLMVDRIAGTPDVCTGLVNGTCGFTGLR